MGEVVAFRPKAPRLITDEPAEITGWLKPANCWRTGRMQIEPAHHFHITADYCRILAADAHRREGREATDASEPAEFFRAWQIEGLKKVFVPAECVRHLHWKQDWLRRHS
ncbi:hypothetical protein NKH52_28605 [Mesorhizobium sp. M1066]|uniref:hypothetical protein n=1 Tax=unclassified Mesorhizobium TaxID=325217 RepID=UPI0033359BFE